MGAGQQFAVGGHQDGGVQAQAVVGTVRVIRLLVQRGVDADAVPAGRVGRETERGAGEQVLGDVRGPRARGPAAGGVIFGKRVRGVAGQREFGQEDDGGSQPGGPPDAFVEFGVQGRGVRLPAVLHDADPQRRAARRVAVRAREGGVSRDVISIMATPVRRASHK